jgi:hypothetical protein
MLENNIQDETSFKKGRGRPKKDKRGGATGNYFASVEANIMNYLNCTDESEKDKIFNEHMYGPLYYMTQTIYMRYYHNKFVIDESIEDIINDTISFIMTKMEKFNPNRGFKAYSYIQTVIKHYIGSKFVEYTKLQNRYTPLKTVYGELQNREGDTDLLPDTEPSIAALLIKNTIKDMEEALQDPSLYELNEKDINVGKCLINILNNWEETLNMGSHKLIKNSIFFQISESTFLDIKNIRLSMKKFKKLYKDGKNNLLNSDE